MAVAVAVVVVVVVAAAAVAVAVVVSEGGGSRRGLMGEGGCERLGRLLGRGPGVPCARVTGCRVRVPRMTRMTPPHPSHPDDSDDTTTSESSRCGIPVGEEAAGWGAVSQSRCWRHHGQGRGIREGRCLRHPAVCRRPAGRPPARRGRGQGPTALAPTPGGRSGPSSAIFNSTSSQ